MEPNNNWNEWEKLIIFRLDQQDKQLEKQTLKLETLGKELQEVSIEINSFKAKAGLLGTLGGILSTFIYFIIDKWWKG